MNADFHSLTVASAESGVDRTRRAKRAKRVRGAVRSYTLSLYPNAGKAEAARYAIWWATRFCLDYVRQLYAEKPGAFVSTAGLGTLNNQAQKRARDILRAGRAAERATGEVFNAPATVAVCADAKITKARGTTFPLWVKVSCGPNIPALPHCAFSRALRAGAVLRPTCELRNGKHGGLVARVFVEYPKHEPAPARRMIGCDVGVNAGVARSDGYIGCSLRPIKDRTREKRAEQQRQHHRRSSARSALKQHLDREARRAVNVCLRTGSSLAIERLKTLGNLKPSGSIGGWARCHFGERARQIAEISNVAVVEVHPAYTSQTCLACDHVDRENRRGTAFRCTRCGAAGHADVLAARNVVRKALGSFPDVWAMRKGRVTNTIVERRALAVGGGAS